VTPLRILHVMRAPVGGLFRHVHDLALEQAARGHAVGIVADESTGGETAEATLTALSARLAYGVLRIPMSRQAGLKDFSAVRAVANHASQIDANVVHGHGAKGGAYARLGGGRALRVYTPHGGSLHFSRSNPVGFAYLGVESLLLGRTDLALFESDYAKSIFERKVGKPRGLIRVVHNGLRPAEFEPVAAESGARELLFVGELRRLKGVDVLIEAIALLKAQGEIVHAVIVGDGADREAFATLADAKGVAAQVAFPGAMPARTAFAKGRMLVVPSRAESLPYVVLEGIAAGLPVIATRVGGIAEIFGEEAGRLIPPADAEALAAAIRMCRAEPDGGATARLRARVSELFTVSAMTGGVLGAYRDAISQRSA
jgi:glycosyltransferase involved in cell wall biosynthesis